ncbi:ATP-binding protein [Alphaproteobacteria bacterium]|nr:ATP-binding protein [Alphaproteobacteria bacterium]
MKFKKIIPSSLLGRSLIIVFIPIITLVTLTTFIFYQTSWNIISKRLTQSVVADVNAIVKLIDQDLQLTAIKLAKEDFKMKVELKENAKLNDIVFYEQRGILSKRLKQALSEINIPFSYDLTNLDKGAIISLQIKTDLLQITVDKDRLYSESAFVFLLWMFFASLILLFLAYFFMKGQMRPLKRLAIIAETFGRGLDAPELKGSGSLEIRQTTNAFNLMQNRIKRFLKQRTEMLAGVSHDLRTPLTRMKLQLSLMKDDNAKKELEHDINEMTAMLNSYVSFVRGEAAEKIEETNINDLIEIICKSNSSDNFTIKYNFEKNIKTLCRPIQIKRALQNIVDNAKRYADKMEIDLGAKNNELFIAISDNGPGIPEKNYEDVFKPFFTLDPSRNKLKGESGLGLTITRDIIRSHGGEIKLFKSKVNGLKILLYLPL